VTEDTIGTKILDNVNLFCQYSNEYMINVDNYALYNILGSDKARLDIKFDVRKSVHHHHHTNEINQPTGFNSFTSLLPDVYVWLNMFPTIIRSVQLH